MDGPTSGERYSRGLTPTASARVANNSPRPGPSSIHRFKGATRAMRGGKAGVKGWDRADSRAHVFHMDGSRACYDRFHEKLFARTRAEEEP